MSKYYLIKECNNIPFILGQFDSIEEAALPSTNKKGASRLFYRAIKVSKGGYILLIRRT